MAELRMRAWETDGDGGLVLRERPVPAPAADEVLVRVAACGVCRTDLHVVHGDLPRHRSPVVPGHEVVGEVVAVGARVTDPPTGARVGIAWLRATCGTCRWCRRGNENLCPRSAYTGWDADGGYADYAVAPAAYVYRLAEDADPLQVAPLLCAGIIGYRALRRAQLPPGGRLGLYGFGASAHLTAQIALAQGAEVHVLTRDPAARELALELGAASAGDAYDEPPVPLDSAIVFAPAGELVPVALAALEQMLSLSLDVMYLIELLLVF
jgi:propanol-preferring alcohol dehydrogenase